MIDKVYMNVSKNEASIIFEDGRVVTLSSGDVSIIDFYLWFKSDVYYDLNKRKEHEERMKICSADTIILHTEDLEKVAA